MQVGTIGYENRSGLGILARDFYINGIVNRILIINHTTYTRQKWYAPEHRFNNTNANKFLDGLDAILLFQNVFTKANWQVIKFAKRRGIRVVMMPMYEFTPTPLPVAMDYYVCPSAIDLDYYKHLPSKFIPVPVEVQWKRREQAEVFVHNAGHGGYGYRNGTPELLKAMEYVKSPIKLIIRAQPDSAPMVNLLSKAKVDPRVTIELVNHKDEDLWKTGDCFIFPEKFNGLSLPLQEAYASGMLVVCGNRYPMNTWLPEEPLIPVSTYINYKCISSVTVKSAIITPQAIAQKIDELYGTDISGYSICGYFWAQNNSWVALRDKYLEVLAR